MKRDSCNRYNILGFLFVPKLLCLIRRTVEDSIIGVGRYRLNMSRYCRDLYGGSGGCLRAHSHLAWKFCCPSAKCMTKTSKVGKYGSIETHTLGLASNCMDIFIHSLLLFVHFIQASMHPSIHAHSLLWDISVLVQDRARDLGLGQT